MNVINSFYITKDSRPETQRIPDQEQKWLNLSVRPVTDRSRLIILGPMRCVPDNVNDQIHQTIDLQVCQLS